MTNPETGEPYGCDICLDTNFIRRSRRLGDRDFGRAELCEHVTRQTSWVTDSGFYVKARIPRVFWDMGIEDYDVGLGRAGAEEYINHWPPDRPMALFTGSPGTGKTSMACAIITDVFERTGTIGQLWTAREIIDRYLDSLKDDSEESPNLVRSILGKLPLLVIDQYGMQNSSPHTEGRLFELIDDAWANRKPVIIITDYPLDMMEDRNWSRLRDEKASLLVDFGEVDRRKR